MASGFHEDYVNIVLNGIFNYGAASYRIINGSNNPIIAADPWICLFDSAWSSSINASTEEVTGGTYTRQQAVFPDAAAGTLDNDSNIDFTLMPAVTVVGVGICATTTEGTDDVILGGDLTAQKACNAGDTFRISAGDLDITLT